MITCKLPKIAPNLAFLKMLLRVFNICKLKWNWQSALLREFNGISFILCEAQIFAGDDLSFADTWR